MAADGRSTDHLLETPGHSSRCRLRMFRDPSWARRADSVGESSVDVSIDGGAVFVDHVSGLIR
jgi:alpha-mannosidase